MRGYRPPQAKFNNSLRSGNDTDLSEPAAQPHTFSTTPICTPLTTSPAHAHALTLSQDAECRNPQHESGLYDPHELCNSDWYRLISAAD